MSNYSGHPNTERECQSFLLDFFGKKIASHLKVKGVLSDYLRCLNDTDFKGTCWSDVTATAVAVQYKMLTKEGIVEQKAEYQDDEDDVKQPQKTAQPRTIGGMLDILTDVDAELMKAICAYCAKDAGYQKRVIAFRKTYFNGRVLTEDEWSAIRASVGLGLFRVSELLEYGVHFQSASEVIDYQAQDDGTGIFTVKFSCPPVELKTMIRREECFPVFGVYQALPDEKGERDEFAYPLIGDSMLGRLKSLGDRLASDFKWNTTEAYTFLATGKPPVNFALSASMSNLLPSASPWPSGLHPYPIRGLITLTVPYWLSPEQVAALYRKCSCQMQMMFKKGATKELSLAGRKLSEKSLRLFLFVEDQKEELDIIGPWKSIELSKKRSIHKKWNDNCQVKGKELDQISELGDFTEQYERAESQCRHKITGWSVEAKTAYDLWKISQEQQ